MDLILEEHIEEIQEQIAQKVRDLYGLDPEVLLYDTTNFFTYIASSNDRNTIARRGKSKAKRNNLRQVGLALLVTKDFHIPLFHKVYQGNIPDVSLFPDFVQDLKKRQIRSLGPHKEATLVFDKGNISEEAMERLIISGQHFVCAVPKKTAQEFFSTSIEDFTLIPGVHGTRGLVKNIQLWGKNFVAVLTYSESLFTGQLCGITTGLQKCQKRLHDLGKELEGWLKKGKRGKKPTLVSVKTSVKKILSSGEHLERLVRISYSEKNGIPQLEYSIDQNALEQLHQNELGRTLIISTRENWTAEEIISAYRGQSEIENAFKEMKNTDILHWQPAFHWTDQKIKVHGLYCVIALLLATLAHKTVVEKGIDISLPRLFHELGKIREVATIFKFDDKSKKKNSVNITKLSPMQKKISDALEIAEVLKG
jgi:transposase